MNIKALTLITMIVAIGLIGCAGTPPPPPPQGAGQPAAGNQPTEGIPPTLHELIPHTHTPAAIAPTPIAQATTADVPAVSTEHIHAEVDLTRLPIGENYMSSGAQSGYIWMCDTTPERTGYPPYGDWIHADGTWDMTARPLVDGSVLWDALVEISAQDEIRFIAGNGLPDHGTGVYPIAANDDARQYDPMIGAISESNVRFQLPANPQLAAQASCVGGTIGVAVNGVLMLAGLDAELHDALAYHVMDECWGHPANGMYHYHGNAPCLDTGNHTLIGYALDGFGIYSIHDENGNQITNADLDDCHGHTHTVDWDGQQVEMYHYHMTYEFPYTVGCYRGTPAQTGPGGGGGNPPRP